MRPLFLGDELTGAAYRLAGIEVRTPPLADAAAAIREAVASGPPLLLVTTQYASRLPDLELESMLAQSDPPMLLVRDAAGMGEAIDMVAWIRGGIVA